MIQSLLSVASCACTQLRSLDRVVQYIPLDGQGCNTLDRIAVGFIMVLLRLNAIRISAQFDPSVWLPYLVESLCATMNMLDLIKQGLFSSIGLASLTQEKITEIVTEVGKHIPLTEQQAREFAEEMSQRSDQAKKTFGEKFDSQLDHAMIQMGLVKNEIRKATESAGGTVNRLLEDQVRRALDQIGVASMDEIEALKKRVAILESKLEKLN